MGQPIRHLLLVGAGHAQLAVLRRFARDPLPGVRLTLLTPTAKTLYSGMLPGLIAGHFKTPELLIDVAGLAAAAGATLLLDRATGIDPAARLVSRAQGPAIGFDVLSLDIGAASGARLVPGALDHAVSLRPIDSLPDRLAAMLATSPSPIVVVGGGAAGVEIVLALRQRFGPAPALRLVAGGPHILPGFSPLLRHRLAKVLADRAIAVSVGQRVTAVSAHYVHFADGSRLPAAATIWATAAAPQPWLATTGLALDHGFLRVNARLQAAPHVFAAGDTVAFHPDVPRSGVHAVRAGPVLAHNLRAWLLGEDLRCYHPQRRALAILATGPRHAVLAGRGPVWSGRWVWLLKRHLDRRWVARHRPQETIVSLTLA